MYNYNYFPGNMKQNPTILDFKVGDVTGDGILDYVYLIGRKSQGSNSPFTENIRIKIIDGKTMRTTIIPLKENAGYNPRLFLGDFTGNKVSDIYVRIDSGGSGGYAFYYIYSFLNNKVKELFDFEKFNAAYKYDVIYQDYYKVQVTNKNTNTTYIIDLTYKGYDYLSQLYNKNGKLKKPTKGSVNALGGLYPVDFRGDNVYGLYAQQRIIGLYNADALGYVQTSLNWKGKKKKGQFVPFFQTIGILGGTIQDENPCQAEVWNVNYEKSETKKDRKLEKAFAKVFGLTPGVDQVRYYYNRIDLNGDGEKETFVYLVGPTVCGSGGCSAAIFKEVNRKYRLLSKFSLVNNPIVVRNKKTNGYKDLIMPVSGGGIQPFCAKMKYDGRTYPQNPSTQPKLKPGATVNGVGIIANDITTDPGIQFG